MTSDTVLSALRSRLQAAAAHNHATEVAPTILLWPDGEKKWLPGLPLLRAGIPSLWTLGDFDPAHNQGPAAWVKWKLGRIGKGEPVPVLYMPGVRRLQFRMLEDFPDPLKPLAELQFQGAWWTQQNGKDWTPLAFLLAKKAGLGLDVAEDEETVRALERLVPHLLETPLERLKKPARVSAEHFYPLLVSDLEDGVLSLLDDERGVYASYTPDEWGVFCDYVRHSLGVDPARDGSLAVAERLVTREKGWDRVWRRYEAAVPGRYSRVHQALEKVQPTALVFDKSTLPTHNDQQEKALQTALAGLGALSEGAARARIRELEAAHGIRRTWVWVRMGKAPLAGLLQHLAILADATEAEPSGPDLDGVAAWYSAGGWRADAAALHALASGGALVENVVRALYLPWLQRVAEYLRDRVQEKGYPLTRPIPIEEGTCTLFADGLRWDLGKGLAESLSAAGFQVDLAGRWTAFPPVTATSKPDVSPVRGRLEGGAGVAAFAPSVSATGKVLTTAAFRDLLTEEGVTFLDADAKCNPSGRGWTEFGDIDKKAHSLGCGVARYVEEQVRELARRVRDLLDAGWKRVRVVTDHGWLLVPGDLPKTAVPPGLAESQWGRCAYLKPTSRADLPTLPWSWDTTVDVAFAPGVSAFFAGKAYGHGGLTLQECWTPVLTVTGSKPAPRASILSVAWVGLRCRVKVDAGDQECTVELRGRAGAPSTRRGPFKTPDDEGACSIPAPPEYEGEEIYVVLLAADGGLLDERKTNIGGTK